jgi:uncharacterized protein YndB with AHSA1/START domain
MIDVTGEITAVRREVGGRVLEAGTARVVTVSRSYPAELADVWDACTNPERIPRWFLPVSGELKEGGRYQLVGNAGGTITRCEAPNGFDATWEMGGEVSWIELRLADEGGGRTRFRLDHIAHVDDERWGRRTVRAVPAPGHRAGGGSGRGGRVVRRRGRPQVHGRVQRRLVRRERGLRHRPGRGPGRRRPHHRVLHRNARARRRPARLTAPAVKH